MIKDILVTLPTGEAPSFAMDYAAAVAKAFDAHITGVAFAQDLAAVGALFDGAAAVVLDHYRREVEAAAEAAKVQFERAWQREGLSLNQWFSAREQLVSLNSWRAPRAGSI